jgi:DNA-binding response OmpR family regulator
MVHSLMPDPRSLTILVAEDDALIGELLGEMLTLMGHTVCAVTTTEADTVAAAQRHAPDLMIVDMGLNPGSGIAAVDLIMRTGFIPHILVSGNIARVRELRPGAMMMEKPYTPAALAAAIARTTAIG